MMKSSRISLTSASHHDGGSLSPSALTRTSTMAPCGGKGGGGGGGGDGRGGEGGGEGGGGEGGGSEGGGEGGAQHQQWWWAAAAREGARWRRRHALVGARVVATRRRANPRPRPNRVWVARRRQPSRCAALTEGGVQAGWHEGWRRSGRSEAAERGTCSMRTALCSGGSRRTSLLCTQLCVWRAGPASDSSYCTRHLSCLTSSSWAR